VIVNYNTKRLLKDCIESIYKETKGIEFDVWVVDNRSKDGSVEMIRRHFPQVKLIENTENLGFARANNQAISESNGEHILLLNPDTVVLNNAIGRMVRFMDTRPETGIAGCKVLNGDGTLQLACRRSIPTPGVAFFRLVGLSRLFPRSRLMAKYNLSYLNPDEPHEVDAVSGACLMIRKEVIEKIGLLDEAFFMYGEELDWCMRAKKAGWKVMYYPDAEIIHYKGESTASNSRKANFEFYKAMYLFHRKYFARQYFFLVNWAIYAGIFLKALTSWKGFMFSTRVGSRG
jgi:GT2 family glycosyltransferase